jgi:hypothetical protein
MKARNALATCIVATLFLVSGFALVRAQSSGQHPMMGQQHQPMMMNNHMDQMQAIMQQMTVVMNRSHQLSGTLGRMMQQQQGTMKDQMQMMQKMSDSMGLMAAQMKTSVEQSNELLQNKTMMQDQGMQQGMNNFRASMEKMTREMETALSNLEMMTKRFEQEKTNQ